VTRTKAAEQRRAELLAAGQALFLAKGIAGTSLDDITQRAGVSKGLFYLYFPSKENLVLALREQFSRELAERMRAAAEAVPVSAGSGWADRLDACVRAGFECYRELHDLHEVLFHHAHVAPLESRGPGSRGPRAAEPRGDGEGQLDPAPAPVARVISGLLAAGLAAGAFDVPDPESTAVLCYATGRTGQAGRRDATRRRNHEAPAPGAGS
jgi:TetR/AcrR family transcriptional repressor of nem operon